MGMIGCIGCKLYECDTSYKLVVLVSSSYVVRSTRRCLGCWTPAFFTSFHLDTTMLWPVGWILYFLLCINGYLISQKQTRNMRLVKFESGNWNFPSIPSATWTPATWTDLNNFQLHLPVVTCRWLAWLAATYLPFHRFLRLPVQSIAYIYSQKGLRLRWTLNSFE